MKFWFNFYKSALHIAIEKNHLEIAKTLLENDKFDGNILEILKLIIFLKFLFHVFFIKLIKLRFLNTIQIQIKSNHQLDFLI